MMSHNYIIMPRIAQESSIYLLILWSFHNKIADLNQYINSKITIHYNTIVNTKQINNTLSQKFVNLWHIPWLYTID